MDSYSLGHQYVENEMEKVGVTFNVYTPPLKDMHIIYYDSLCVVTYTASYKNSSVLGFSEMLVGRLI